MTHSYLLFTGSLVTGLGAGVIAGLFGVGGGIIIVPALLFLFLLDGINPVFAMQLAVGTSLATIIITNISAAWNHHLRRSVHWPLVGQYTPGILMGAIIGAQVATRMDGNTLRTLFGLFEIVVGLKMVLHTRKAKIDAGASAFLNAVLGIGIGGLSTLFGIGGGTLSVPALTLISGLDMRQAVGSSSAIGIALAVAGTSGFIQAGWNNAALPSGSMGYVVPTAFFGIILGTLATTPIGVRLAHRIEPGQLKKGFGIFLIGVGIKLIWG